MHLKPKKSLGQNFLTDRNIRDKIISYASVLSQDTILEIGAGKGEMTLFLAAKAKKVYAVELDSRLIPYLKELFREHKNIELIHGDILKLNLSRLIKEKRIKVLANIPYYISTPIIEKMVEFKKQAGSVYLTLQKEFALRATAKPGEGDYGSFSCFVRYYFDAKILFNIGRGCFTPVPKVDSAFVSFKVRPKPPVRVKDEKRLFKIIRSAFNQRRKTLRNSLRGLIPKGLLEEKLRERGLDLNVRPERLSLSDFAALANL